MDKNEVLNIVKDKRRKWQDLTLKDLKDETCLLGTGSCAVHKNLLSIQAGNKNKNKMNLPDIKNQCAKAMTRCLRARAIGIIRAGGFKERCTGSLSGMNKVTSYKKTNGTCKGAGEVSDHATGDALDLFTRWTSKQNEKVKSSVPPNEAQEEAGNTMVEWLKLHGNSYGVKNFVWNEKKWTKVSGKWVDVPNSKKRPHYDHVHVSFKKGCTL